MSAVTEAELRVVAARLAVVLEATWLSGERSPLDRAQEVVRLAVAGRRQDILERRFAPLAWGLINMARFTDARRLSRAVLSVMDHPRVHHAMARAGKELGDSTAAQGAYRDALRQLEAAAAVESPPGRMTHDLAEVLAEAAGIDRAAGRRGDAAAGLRRALDLAVRVLKDEALESYVLHEIAVFEMDEGAWDAAAAHLQRALEIEREAHDVRGMGRTLHAMAQCANYQGRPDVARSLFEQALELKSRAGDLAGEAVTLHDLALLTPDSDEARAMHERSLEISRETGDVRGVAANLRALAAHELRHGQPDEAARLAAESLSLAREFGEPVAQAGALHEQASADWQRGRMAEARQAVDEALDLADHAGDRRVTFDLAVRWGERELTRADGGDRARALLDKAVGTALAMGHAGRHAEATRLRVRLADLRGTTEAIGRLAAAGRAAAREGAWDELAQCCVELAVHDPDHAGAWNAQALWIIAALVKGRMHTFPLAATLEVIRALASTAPPQAERNAGLAALAFALTPSEVVGRLDLKEGQALRAALVATAMAAGVAEGDLERWMNERVLPRGAQLQAPLLDRVEAIVPTALWLVDRGPLRAAGASGAAEARGGGPAAPGQARRSSPGE